MRFKIVFITLALILGTIPVLNAADISKPFPQNYPMLLFVQSITSGSFDGQVLTLKEENPLVLYFSDRPNRFTGHMTKRRFLKLWNDGMDSFKKEPPNAVLSILNDENVNNVVVELFSPVVDGCIWKYTVKVLSGNLPKTFSSSSLFVDAFPTAVNSQITDSVTQANTKVFGDAPAVAMGSLYQATSQALSNAAHNATNNQQQSGVTAQAATTMGVATLYSLDTASTGTATQKILGE